MIHPHQLPNKKNINKLKQPTSNAGIPILDENAVVVVVVNLSV